ncbi:S8 family serine peptidase, partial [candidate division WOR-3 bacterium]|nr:S8 family serine peptidase [candidate division WOR-3 bacterium]
EQRTVTDEVFPLARPRSIRSSAVDSAEAHRFYGPSFDQARMMGVPEVFFRGFFGSGVRLAIFDTGIKPGHVAVEHLRIAAQHDFLSGDNFRASSSAGGWQPSTVENLRYFGLAKDPALHDQPGSGTLHLAFAADSFAYGYSSPRRGLFVTASDDFGASWSDPEPLALSQRASQASFHSFENLRFAGRGPVSWLAWNDIGYAYSGGLAAYIFLSWHRAGTWRGTPISLGAGRYPSLQHDGDTLRLAYVSADSVVNFLAGLADSTAPDPDWLLAADIAAPEALDGLELAAAAGRVTIIGTGLRTGRILQFRSDNGGLGFGPAEELVSSRAWGAKLCSEDEDLFLFYRDVSEPPFTRLRLLHSPDLGATWQPRPALTDTTLTVGELAVSRDAGRLTLVSGSAGSLWRRVSTDDGLTWSPAELLDTTGFGCQPAIASRAGATRVTWLMRGDDNAGWEPGDTARFSFDQPDHGTRMASIIAGYQQGGIVGIAPGVDLLVAKTELHKVKSGRYYEYDLEEDTYIQALEWAERLGADIVSTSLGYRGWYTDDQFDGKTAPVSVAASLAAERGLVVVTAMGNRDTTRYPLGVPYITAPADAEGVISAGGVERNMLPWRGTGTGPTSDGRTKPELVALSDTVAVCAPDSTGALEGSVGTSCATALIAGACALLKEAHPSWTAESLKAALFSTATRSTQSCTFGFGVPRVDSAFAVYPPEPSVRPVPGDRPWAFPNPYSPARDGRVFFGLDITRPASRARLAVFTASGVLVDTIRLDAELIGRPGRYADIGLLERAGAFWDGTNAAGEPVASGLYLCVLETTFGEGIGKFALVR